MNTGYDCIICDLPIMNNEHRMLHEDTHKMKHIKCHIYSQKFDSDLLTKYNFPFTESYFPMKPPCKKYLPKLKPPLIPYKDKK